MLDREIIERKVNLKDSKLTKEQKVKVYDLIEERHDVFSSWYEIGTCPKVNVQPK